MKQPRYLCALLRQNVASKILLLSGPRQVGKTTLAKSLFLHSFDDLNYDIPEMRLQLKRKAWRRSHFDFKAGFN